MEEREETQISKEALDCMERFAKNYSEIYAIWDGVHQRGLVGKIPTYYFLSEDRVPEGFTDEMLALGSEVRENHNVTETLMFKKISRKDVEKDNNLGKCLWRKR